MVQDGSQVAAELRAGGHQAASSILAYPEGRAALGAARRAARLTVAAHRRACEDFDELHRELLLIGIDAQLAREAAALAERFALRGYDAVHLATALAVAEPTTLVSWDRDLRRAALASGCAIAPAQ